MSTPKEPGVHFVPREEYDRLARVNWSTLKWIDTSPAHYQQVLLEKTEDTDPKKLGRACHLAVFEPEQFKSRCVVWEDGARRGKAWEAFVDRHPDDEILTVHQYETALAVGRAVRSSTQAKPYVSGGQSEVTVLWNYDAPPSLTAPGYRVECKSRIDFVAEVNALVDLKTINRIGGASPEAFPFTCRNLKYKTQAAFYRRAYQRATGQLLPYFIVAVETMAPFAVQTFQLTDKQLAEGEEHFKQLLDIYDGCRRRNDWPQYSPEAMPLPEPFGEDDEWVTEMGLTPAIGFGTT